MEKKENVLIVHNYYQLPGGEDTVVVNEKNMLEKEGHKVILYTRNNSELKEAGIIQKILLPVSTIFNFKTYRDIRKIIKEQSIRIVHVHNTLSLISPSVYYAAKSRSIPIVQTIHNFRMLCPGATFYRNGEICEECVEKGLRCSIKYGCYRGSKLLTLACVMNIKFHRKTGIYGKINYICLTGFNRKKLLQIKGINESKVFVKPNFVESSGEFIPADQRENRIVFAGRLEKLKGIDILLKAWKRMGDLAPELFVCGTGPMEGWCRDYIERNKLEKVKLMGFLHNVEVKKLIANSKALILPTQCYEGFPMSIVEAFSVGTPVICSNLGNAGDIVKENITGAKFEYRSESSLIDAVQRIDSYSNINELVVREFKTKYSIEKNYLIIKKIYEKVSN